MKIVTVYTRRNCALCRAALDVLEHVRKTHSFEVKQVDIEQDMAADDKRRSAFAISIPVVELDGDIVCENGVDAAALTRRLNDGATPA